MSKAKKKRNPARKGIDGGARAAAKKAPKKGAKKASSDE